ncbi:ANKRD31, partial [Symbiodinium pilosum]
AIKADIRVACQPRGPQPAQRDGTFAGLVAAVRARATRQHQQPGSDQTGAAASSNGLHPKIQPQLALPQPARPQPRPPGPTVGRKPHLGTKELPNKLPDVDNEGRPYNLKLVVVNFNNVGTSFGAIFNKGKEPRYNWEGVRRCVKELTRRGLKIIGVIYQHWRAWDGDVMVNEIPQDIRSQCESIQETPRIPGVNQRSADDEMTIKCAYHRNCRILDNDNYKDWLHTLRTVEIRNWYSYSQDRVHMKYFFDSDVGVFETLDGNAERGASEEREERRPRTSRNRSQHSDDRICVTPPEDDRISVLPETAASASATVLFPTEAAYRHHRGPTITMPSSLLDKSLDTVDLTADSGPKQIQASKMDVNTSKAGWTPLCTAASQGKVESVKQLLMLGADPNVPNSLGAHPIFYALRNWSLRMFRLLAKHGADVQRARSERGESLQDYAERKVQQVAKLEAFGAARFSSASCQERLRGPVC